MTMPPNIPKNQFLSASRHKTRADQPTTVKNRGALKALKGREGIRLRVGDWRVIMDDAGEVLDILEIGPRGGIYD